MLQVLGKEIQLPVLCTSFGMPLRLYGEAIEERANISMTFEYMSGTDWMESDAFIQPLTIVDKETGEEQHLTVHWRKNFIEDITDDFDHPPF